MQAPFDNIVRHLFHQPSLYSVTVDELENMALQHPYFAAAHFLLLKKMQDIAHPRFTAQLHKTTIYFNNPLWLQFLLQPETVDNFTVSETAPFITSEPADHSLIYKENNGDDAAERMQQPAGSVQETFSETGGAQEPAGEAAVAGADAQLSDQTTLNGAHGGIMDVITEIFSDANPLYSPVVESGNSVIKEETPLRRSDEPITQHEEIEHKNFPEDYAIEGIDAMVPENIPGPAAHTMSTEGDAPAAGVFAEETPGIAIPANDTDSPELQRGNDHTNEVEQTIQAEQAPENAGIEQQAPAINNAEAIVSVSTDKQTGLADDIEAGDNAHRGNEKNISALHENQHSMETPGAKDDLLFEPYHTVDYFASQGIRLGKMEADAKDKLGRQLKSFTEWLKTMKKLPQVSIDKILAENEESKVVEDASHSLDAKEVVTEAMAEVYEKQGLYAKAIEVYDKLSLLNPHKSTYFAGKMDALKK